MNALDDFINERADLALSNGMYPASSALKFQVIDILQQNEQSACFLVTCDGDVTRCILKAAMQGLDHEYSFLTGKGAELYDIIPRPIAYWVEGGRQYLLREYVPGRTLQELFVDEFPFKPHRLRQIADMLAATLVRLHSAGLIHRDLKPENVVLTDGGRCMLIDTGTFRTYSAGKSRDTLNLGTPTYASPEQLCDMQTDDRSDVYAFGRVMLYLSTGTLDAPAGRLHGHMGRIIRRCLAFSPRDRYKSMIDVRSRLRVTAMSRRHRVRNALLTALIMLTISAATAICFALPYTDIVLTPDMLIEKLTTISVGTERTLWVLGSITLNDPLRVSCGDITLCLLGNITLNEPVTVSRGDLTLCGVGDLTSGQKQNWLIRIDGGAALTIMDGIRMHTDNVDTLICNCGALNLTGGQITMTGIASSTMSAIINDGGSVNLTGGLVCVDMAQIDDPDTYYVTLNNMSGTTVIDGARVEIVNTICMANSVLVIEGKLIMNSGEVRLRSRTTTPNPAINVFKEGEFEFNGGSTSPEPYVDR